MSTSAPREEVVIADVHIGGHHDHPVNKTDISAGTAVAVNASRLVLAGGDVRGLYGWSLAETTGAAVASVRLRDGATAATELLATIRLASGASSLNMFDPYPLRVSTGRIFLEVVAGSVEGVLYWT